MSKMNRTMNFTLKKGVTIYIFNANKYFSIFGFRFLDFGYRFLSF